MRIYFAGKIGPDDWRAELFGSRAGATEDCAPEPQDSLLDPEYIQDMGGGIVYGGPFFISCDHSCAHGPTSHGVGATSAPWLIDSCHSLPEGALVVCSCGVETTAGKQITRSDVYRVNCARIQRADWVFAYIDSFTAYGTFFEVGYAVAHAIPVALAFSLNLGNHGNVGELWVLQQAAKRVYYGLAGWTFEQFCRDNNLAWSKATSA